MFLFDRFTMTMTNSLVQSLIFLRKLVLMFDKFLFFEIVLQISSPFIIEFSWPFEISSLIKRCSLRCDSVMNNSQVSLLLHLCFLCSGIALGSDNSQKLSTISTRVLNLSLEGNFLQTGYINTRIFQDLLAFNFIFKRYSGVFSRICYEFFKNSSLCF